MGRECHVVSDIESDRQFLFVFFFNDTATTEICTLSPHDALPIFCEGTGEKKKRMKKTNIFHVLSGVGPDGK